MDEHEHQGGETGRSRTPVPGRTGALPAHRARTVGGTPTPGGGPVWTPGGPAGGGGEERLSAGAAARVEDGLAEATKRAYQRDWAAFERWCRLHGRTALPAGAATLAEYVHHLTTTTTQYGRPPAPASIDRALGCIQSAHQMAGLVCETRPARLALRAYRRERAGAGHRTRQAPAITLEVLRSMVTALLHAVAAGRLGPVTGLRDQVALVLGFAMFGRRSEIAALDIADLAFSRQGLTVTVRRSKTDQDALGAAVHLKYGTHLETCPVRLTQAWIDTLTAHGITDGPLLRGIDRHGHLAGTPGHATGSRTPRLSGETLNRIVRAAARRADLEDPDRYTYHGLRAGGATTAAQAGAAPSTIADHGRWSGLLMVMRYWRTGHAWHTNALDGTGL